MGCDIHCYVEYRGKNFNPVYPNWDGFGGCFDPGRNYDIFARLAGVRAYDTHREGDLKPRGLPDDLGYDSKADNQLYIVEDTEANTEEGHVKRSIAAKWVASYGCEYVMSGGRQAWVTHPDYHSHSWVTADELEFALKDHPGETEYKALLAVMRSLEQSGNETRLVFWFDN